MAQAGRWQASNMNARLRGQVGTPAKLAATSLAAPPLPVAAPAGVV